MTTRVALSVSSWSTWHAYTMRRRVSCTVGRL